MPDILRGYTFSRQAARYRDTGNGRFVSRTRIVSLLEQQVNTAEQRLGDIVQSLFDGEISPGYAQSMMRDELRRLNLQNGALGKGGWDRMTFRDYGRAGNQLRDSYGRVTNLMNDIQSGRATLPQALNRVRGYIGEARRQFFAAERDAMRESGRRFEERRRLGASEHCFPAGTMIQTPTGERPIESLSIGELVTTRHGARRVTQLFTKEATDIWQVRADGKHVMVTGNHPFLTQDGWERVDKLKASDQLVLYENGTYYLERHVALPNALNSKVAFGKVSILGRISGSLLDLPFFKRFKTRMTMPPIAIGLNDQFTNADIHNKFWLDHRMRLVGDTQIVKDAKQALLKFCGVRLLNAAMTLKELFDNVWPAQRLFSQAFRCSRLLRWIVANHIFGCFGVNDLTRCRFGQAQFEAIGTSSDTFEWQAKLVGTPSGALGGIIFGQKPILAFRPSMSACDSRIAFGANTRRKVLSLSAFANISSVVGQRFRSARMTHLGFAPTHLAAAHARARFLSWQRYAFATVKASRIIAMAFMSTFRACMPRSILREFEFHKDIPVRRPLHHRNDAPSQIVPHSVTVYNLEVDQVHEYIANGFVVHNCEDCVGYARLSWQPIGTLPLPGERSVCGKACRCSMERREVVEAVEERIAA